MINILTSRNSVGLSNVLWIIHGLPKVGKTTFASGWPNAIFITTEQRINHLKDIKYIPVSNWDEFTESVDMLGSKESKLTYKTVVLDVVEDLFYFCELDLCRKNRVRDPSDMPLGKGFRIISFSFREQFFKLRKYGYNILCISHTKIDEVKSIKNSSQQYLPSPPSRCYNKILAPNAGVICSVNIEQMAVKNKNRLVRIVRFNDPSGIYECRDGEGVLPEWLPLYRDPYRTYQFIERYYGGVKEGG